MEYIQTLQENVLPYLRNHSYFLIKKSLSALPQSTTDQLSSIQTEILEPYIIQPLVTLLSMSSSDLVSVAIMLIVLYISLRILDYARRVVMFWVTLAVRLCFWASVLGVGFYVYNVGLERAITEAGWIWGIVQGFIEDFIANAEGDRQRGSGGGYGYSGGGRGRGGSSSGYQYQRRSGRGKW